MYNNYYYNNSNNKDNNNYDNKIAMQRLNNKYM